jgi:hypothetical protein
MNKKILTSLATITVIMVFSTTINSVFAVTEIYEHQYGGGDAFIDVPGKPKIEITMYRVSGHFGRVSDRLLISVESQSNPGKYIPVRGWEDNPERAVFSGGDTVVVKSWQITVFSIGKTAIAIWTIPLEVPATVDTPAFTIHPGLLIVKGSGDKVVDQFVIPGFLTVDINESYDATEGKLISPGWCSGTVTGYVVKDNDWYWTL